MKQDYNDFYRVKVAFGNGDRARAWEIAVEMLPIGDRVRRLAKRYTKAVRLYEALKTKINQGPLYSPSLGAPVVSTGQREALQTPIRGPRIRPRWWGSDKGTRPHAIQRWRVQQSWKHFPTIEDRRRRTEPARRALRFKHAQKILAAIHPRIRKLRGDRALLMEMGHRID